MAMDKTFDAAEAETRIYRAWEAAGAFRAGANARPGTDSYCVMIPPPNVTGVLHMGHAFNNTLQDILVRWHRMRGFDTLWQPGQDHAGIATQMVVERELARDSEYPGRREMGREAFLEKVWEWKGHSGGTIVSQLKRLGASCDWSRNAFTMSGAPGAPDGEEGNFHDAVIKVFVEMYNKGLIYRGKRLVNWDPKFETAISDLEVENIEVEGHMWHFKYPLAGGETYRYIERDEDGAVILEEERNYISIATTRPETMLGDGAVAVHPDDRRYAPIVGKLCEIPVGPKSHRRRIPIIVDEYPDPDFGSGAVKITGAHDFNDYGVATRNRVPMYRLMNTRGEMRDDGVPYAEAAARAGEIANGGKYTDREIDALNLVPDHLRGLDRFDARKRVVAEITAEGLTMMTRADDPRLGRNMRGSGTDDIVEMVPLVEAKLVTQPFGDRSKVVVEPMLTDQWFVDVAKVVGPAIERVRDGTVRILPDSGYKTYFHWLENIEPWCISRQLWWGHRIPVWYGPEFDGTRFKATFPLQPNGPHMQFCGANEDDIRRAAENVYGRSVRFLDPLDWSSVATAVRDLVDGKAEVVPLWRDPDVLDTWFSSGLWPIGTLGWPEDTPELRKYFPTSVLVTGFDILFFWVARMMMMQLAVVGEVPFRTVYLHGLVRDAKGRKMSKSTGNAIDPLDLIDRYGADALRFANAAMASLGGALKLDTNRIQGYRNFGTKIWNAMRFAEMNEVFAAACQDVPAPQGTVNKWILGETARLREAVDSALEAYRFNDAANALHGFVWGKVCDWYVEFAKPLLQGEDGALKAETRRCMKWVLDQSLIMLHPIMPFVTEELWGLSGQRSKMLVHADWPEYTAREMVDLQSEREIRWVIGLIEAIRSARAQMHVSVGRHIPILATRVDTPGQIAWERNETLIRRLARVESLAMVSAFPKGTIAVPVDGAIFGLPLGEIIDVDRERARLERTLGLLAKEVGNLRGRLDNPGFVASAPEHVVQETGENLASRTEEYTKLKEALNRLNEFG